MSAELLIASWVWSRPEVQDHFISSRLTEWALTCPLPSLHKKKKKASNQICASQGCGSPWAQQHCWWAGGGSEDWFRTWLYKSAGPEPRYLLGDSHLTGEHACYHECDGCLFACWVSGFTLANSIRHCPSQIPTTVTGAFNTQMFGSTALNTLSDHFNKF